MKALRIVSLNLRHGGGDRIAGLADWLLAQAPEVVVLPEWRNNEQGRYMTGRLAEHGLNAAYSMRERGNTVLVAGPGLSNGQDLTPANSEAGSLLSVEAFGIRIVGCYFPQMNAKAPFFSRCLQAAQQHSAEPFLLIGDLNTGRNDLDREGGVRFACVKLFEALDHEAGLVDLYRAEHGDRREWTWRSSKNGFRVDHAFANRTLLNRYRPCRYVIDHDPRMRNLTDHSAVVLDLRMES